MNESALLEAVREIAAEAGEAILDVYNGEDFAVETKGDDSPLTRADMAAHRIIVARLEALTPDIPVLSEESDAVAAAERRGWSRFWLVDPLDGTKEFIKRNGEFTVNIALIDDHRPVLGVVHVPPTGVTYLGGVETGAFREEQGERRAISVRPRPASPVVLVASRSHGTDKLAAVENAINSEMGPVERTSMGSSLKICLVAEGAADIYPRLAPTCEWDTAAAHAVVRAAGGWIVDTDFRELTYNRRDDLLNPHFLVLGTDPERWRFLAPVLGDA